jgi:hypothetical protein
MLSYPRDGLHVVHNVRRGLCISTPFVLQSFPLHPSRGQGEFWVKAIRHHVFFINTSARKRNVIAVIARSENDLAIMIHCVTSACPVIAWWGGSACPLIACAPRLSGVEVAQADFDIFREP